MKLGGNGGEDINLFKFEELICGDTKLLDCLESFDKAVETFKDELKAEVPGVHFLALAEVVRHDSFVLLNCQGQKVQHTIYTVNYLHDLSGPEAWGDD